jgi:hypothetical protein
MDVARASGDGNAWVAVSSGNTARAIVRGGIA